MMLHADVLLLEYNNQIHKHIYFTTAYRSNQEITDSLTIASLVIKQIATDFPNLKELFCKSDNAGSYRGNFYAQPLYEICKSNEINFFALITMNIKRTKINVIERLL